MRRLPALLGASMSLLAACSAAQPPPELANARATVTRASAGPAARTSPSRVRQAEHALALAEHAYEDGQLDEAHTQAVVARRRAEAAEADVDTMLARRRFDDARAERARLAGQPQRRNASPAP